MIIPFPTEDDFKRIGETLPYSFPSLRTEDIAQFFSDSDPFFKADKTFEIVTWVNSFNVAIGHIKRSYVFVNFYFEQGVPEGIDFSDFDSRTYFLRDFFYYFAEFFFYKLFSAWDIIGHIILLVRPVKAVKKPSFKKALEELKRAKLSEHSLYISILNDPVYKEAERIRHDITHNVPSSVVDERPIQAAPIMWYFGTTQYAPPSKTLSAANNAIPLLERTIKTLLSTEGT